MTPIYSRLISEDILHVYRYGAGASDLVRYTAVEETPYTFYIYRYGSYVVSKTLIDNILLYIDALYRESEVLQRQIMEKIAQSLVHSTEQIDVAQITQGEDISQQIDILLRRTEIFYKQITDEISRWLLYRTEPAKHIDVTKIDLIPYIYWLDRRPTRIIPAKIYDAVAHHYERNLEKIRIEYLREIENIMYRYLNRLTPYLPPYYWLEPVYKYVLRHVYKGDYIWIFDFNTLFDIAYRLAKASESLAFEYVHDWVLKQLAEAMLRQKVMGYRLRPMTSLPPEIYNSLIDTIRYLDQFIKRLKLVLGILRYIG